MVEIEKYKIESVLQSIYLGIITEKLNKSNPFISSIVKSSDRVCGQYIKMEV